MSGGISQVFGATLQQLPGDTTTGCDPSKGGMVLTYSDGSTHRLFANLGMVLPDGAAHKLTLMCKGDASSRLCMLCRELVSAKSYLTDEDGEGLLTCCLVLGA